MKKPNAKQQRFVDEYLIDLNATQSAIRAGYSKKTAYSVGHEILNKPEIESAIAKAQAERAERLRIDADWVLTRLAEEVTADLADLYDDAGAFRPIKEWPEIWRQGLVSGLDTNQVVEIEGGRKTNQVFKLRLSDRMRRLELIGKHIGVNAFADRKEVTGADGGPVQTKEVSNLELARRVAFLLASAAKDQESR